jgi:hypothetical protein
MRIRDNAISLFEEQRELTDEEMQAYKEMLQRKENDMELIRGRKTPLKNAIVISDDMRAFRLGMPDNSSSDFIRREDLIDAIDGTDWYHMHEGKIVYGALDEGDDPLYKIDEIIEAIKNLPKRRW